MTRKGAALIWALVTVVIAVPVWFALTSPLLQWREPVYIIAAFAGVVGMAFLLLQPLLVGGFLPGLGAPRGRHMHRVVGGALVLAVFVHVAGLWITSPPDVVDALLFRSPTPFSVWGVIAMWAIFLAALLAIWRRQIGLRKWRLAHTGLALVIVVGTVVHALLIEGTMEPVSKAVFAGLILVATTKVIGDLRGWFRRRTPR